METIIKKKTMMYVFVAGETTIVKPFFVYPEEKKIKTGDWELSTRRRDMMRKVLRLLGLAMVSLGVCGGLHAADDWTQSRHDECRSGVSTEVLPASLYLQWRRDLPTRPSEYVDA
jgi:hypothetical protein